MGGLGIHFSRSSRFLLQIARTSVENINRVTKGLIVTNQMTREHRVSGTRIPVNLLDPFQLLFMDVLYVPLGLQYICEIEDFTAVTMKNAIFWDVRWKESAS
jgi:hypothetical protein